MSASDGTPTATAEIPGSTIGELVQAAGVTVRELLDRCPSDDPMRGKLEQVQGTMQRLVALTGPSNPGGPRRPPRATTLDLNTVVRQLAPSLQRLLGPFIALETELHPAGVWAAADRGQVEQVALGLVINAREALPIGGTICLRTRRRVLANAVNHWIGKLGPGEWATVEVTDNGTGIDERTVHHLREPSFRGLPFDSSLSLATVSAIVRGAGGQVVLDTTPGGGT
ncbi:MAG: ATP-binding protein, partial [Gemmatimonadales bacterium]